MLKKGAEKVKAGWNPIELLRVYRSAAVAATQDSSPESKIRAFNKVINYCDNSEACSTDDSLKRNVVLYWTYNHLGDAWAQRHQAAGAAVMTEEDLRKAISFYQEAVDIAPDGEDKLNSLQRIAEIYKHMQNVEKLSKLEEGIVDSLDDAHKTQGYLELATATEDNYKSAEWLEKALSFVMKEKVNLLEKCQNTLLISDMLLKNYQIAEDKVNRNRMERLINKTAMISIRALEEKIANEEDRSAKLELYAAILKIVNQYCKTDSSFRMKAYQKIVNSLDVGEVLSLESLLKQN